MKTLLFISILVFLVTSCKKDDNTGLPQVITGKWGLSGINITGLEPIKSAYEFNSNFKDTIVIMNFSLTDNLQYFEFGRTINTTNQISIIDTLYQCQSTYNVTGNNLTIDHLVPKFKPYFTVKDYTFSLHKETKDTVLTINYVGTAWNVPAKYTLTFYKVNY